MKNDDNKILDILTFLADRGITASSKQITQIFNVMGGTSKSLATKLGWMAVQGHDVVTKVWKKK